MSYNIILQILFFSLTSLLLLLQLVSCSSRDHQYNVGDDVPLFVNKVGPLNNPSETYEFYDLPFCRPAQVLKKSETFGEVLNGDRLTNSLYKLKFREDKTVAVLCQKTFTGNEVSMFRNAVGRDFYFQMYYDDLPFWAFVGKVEEYWTVDGIEAKYILFKHVQFDVFYNDHQIIEIRAFSDPNHVVDITEDAETDAKFTYSVMWKPTSISFMNRLDKYSKTASLPTHKKIHWFSFINSVVIILLLMGLLSLLFMRHLRNDLKSCSSEEDGEDNDVGWKYIHGDVFRHPPRTSLFCAFLGSGVQLFIMICVLFVLSFIGVLYPYNRGAICGSLIVIYALTSIFAGYAAASVYSQFSETRWERGVFLSGIVYLGPVLVTLSNLNAVAVFYGATAALPFGTIIVILACLLVSIPLIALGGLIGYHSRSDFQKTSTPKYPTREIPPLPLYRKMPGQMFIGGLLPFSAIALELHHLLSSLWGYKIFTLPIILFVTFVILILLTIILSIGLTYIQLYVEDHEWWWRSFLRGGSTAIFMFAYCIYYYSRSNMIGFLQLAFFLGYNACMCYTFFLLLGTVGFYASWVFVRRIYSAVKGE